MTIQTLNGFSDPAIQHIDACVMTIGNFDGLHIGHQKILEHVLTEAQQKNLPSLLMTFEPHPSQILRPDYPYQRLMSLEDKIAQLDKVGFDFILVQAFDDEFAHISAEDFYQRIIKQSLHARSMYIGYDFHFGYQREGSVRTLKEFAAQDNMEIHSMGPVEIDNQPVSSSRIRKLLSAGQIEESTRLLGKPYQIKGRRVSGAGRGKKIGVPTINLEFSDVLVPALGVYGISAYYQQQWRPAVMNIGMRPTFETDAQRSCEVHLLDMNAETAPATMDIQFHTFLRGEKKFSGADELTAQIQLDIEAYRNYAHII